MKDFVERLQNDEEFAAEFRDFMISKNEKVKEGTRLVGQQLDKLVMGSIKDFAASKGIELTDDEQSSHSLAALSKQICLQMDDMIIKSFEALEGSVKQPVDVPPEMIAVLQENEELYTECMHKADKAVDEAITRCGRELDAAVMAALKEFAEKTGYNGPYPSTRLNKTVAAKLNEVVGTQFKGLLQVTRTSVANPAAAADA